MAELTTSTVYGNLTVSGKIVGAINEVNDGAPVKIWVGTEAEYNALSSKDPNTLYFLT
jgi:hypothetical protein